MSYVNLKDGSIYRYEEKGTVEIDDLIVPVIVELNKKGYETRFCCSGHYDDETTAYIMFEPWVKLRSTPKGWGYEVDDNIIRFYYTEYDWYLNGDVYEFTTHLIFIMSELYEWSKSLDEYYLSAEMRKVREYFRNIKSYFITPIITSKTNNCKRYLDAFENMEMFLVYYYRRVYDLYFVEIYREVITKYIMKHVGDKDLLDRIYSLYSVV